MKQYLHTTAETVLKITALTAVFALALGINYIAAWTSPTGAPPTNNVSAPLNVSGTAQVKNGNVSVGASGNTSANLGLTVYGSQSTTGDVRSGGELQSTLSTYGNVRMIGGNYGAFFRNDGANTYFLLTAAGDQSGTWNALRPMYINDITGQVNLDNGVTVRGTGVTFADGSVQTTAAGAGGTGKLLAIRSYTANATWSKPAGLSYVVVKVWGGGGAGENFAGAAGAAGGASSFGAFLSATGGTAGSGAGGVGGTGSGGDINLSGQNGERVQASDGNIGAAGGGGGSAAGGGGGGGPAGFANNYNGLDGKVPGGGGGGAGDHHASNAPAGGGGGGYSEKRIDASSLGATVAVTVGAGGADAGGSPVGGSGAAGMVIVYEYQ